MAIDWQLAAYNLAADVSRLEAERDQALRERDEALCRIADFAEEIVKLTRERDEARTDLVTLSNWLDCQAISLHWTVETIIEKWGTL